MARALVYRVVRVEPREKARPSDPDMVLVTYGIKVKDGYMPEWQLPISVSLDHIRDEDLITVARSHLALMFEQIVAETVGWRLDKEWFDQHVKP